MIKELYVQQFYPAAKAAGEKFRINPVMILAQSAIESGWGESTLARMYHNYFGITAYGKVNEFWHGGKIELSATGLPFRRYDWAENSFMDFARLIRSAYSTAADVSFHPKAYAQEMAYSKYISEVNGDNRASYRQLLIRIAADIERLIPEKAPL